MPPRTRRTKRVFWVLMEKTVLAMVVLAAGFAQAPQPGTSTSSLAASMPVVVAEQPLELPADPLRVQPPGAVVLETTIDTTGAVGDVAIVEAPDAVAGRAAADALRRWRFEPATRDGQPVAVVARFTYPVGPGAGVQAISTDVAFPVGNGTEAPRVLREVRPAYPVAALSARVSGNVQLTCVVLPDGHPADIRVRDGLEPTLDRAAADALRKWTFQPGRRAGTAVPVMVEVEFAFTPV
jgi:TonB family protein